MHKALYRTPAKRRKEDFYYIVKIGRNEVSLVVVSEEATYFRIKETLQRMVNEGALEPVFQSNEGVHIRRVGRYPKDLSNKDSAQFLGQIYSRQNNQRRWPIWKDFIVLI